ncbi:cytosine permease [Evansella cellulosilytica]|uniref:Permease for cytosine/purines uracil thiamine allantoin n=1 Tax=Evansella cellulosilytica (strain ATCC 21833 / DSM 2522 / FERM P-1141 / JCM 9156 / N-4) TaxID=649639 RepID=E6TQY4_EVAC2|nr:cytosine permease [Evansella cellulosilytica]ADU29360.1 permease for cytosine/purines uracil thiamine allantoin [Evansella cellulosilytica DSM 2522]
MKQSAVDNEFALEAVPSTNRRGFWKMLVVMLGFTFFSASMWSGGTLGNGLTFTQFILIVLAGNLILGLYTGALAYIAANTGLSTHLLARYAFGEKGSYVSSFMLAATQVGWFGVGAAMFALPVQKVTGVNEYLLVFLVGILMTATAYFGMKALVILSFIAVPSITVLGSISVYNATESIGGFSSLFDYQPPEMIGLAAALTICVGSFISGGTLTPDFTRFAKTKKTAVITTLVAFFIGNSLMFIFGAIGAISTGESDISEVMFIQGLIIPAIIILGLNIWTTNDNALYASGLGFSNITKISKNKLVIFNGLVGTVFALWLNNNFVGWLTFLGSTLPAIGAIILADYFILNKGKYNDFKAMTFKPVNWIALAAWGIGILLATYVPGIPPLNAIIGSAVVYIIMMKFVGRDKDGVIGTEKVS